MKTAKKKEQTAANWGDLYQKVVTDISKKESLRETEIKEDLYEKFKRALNGKELIIHNSCK